MLNIIWVKLKDYISTLPMVIIMTIMALVLIYIFGQGFDSGFQLDVGIVDKDESYLSQEYINEVMNKKGFSYTKMSEEEGEKAIDNGYIAIVIIEDGFENNLLEGNAKVSIESSGESLEHQTLRANIESIGRLYGTNEMYIKKMKDFYSNLGIVYSEIDIRADIVSNIEKYPVLQVIVKSLDQKVVSGYDPIKHSFIGYLLFFSMFAIIFSIGSIVDEKQSHVWYRQRVTPISGIKVLGANLLTTIFTGSLQMWSIVIIGKVIFKIELGGSLVGLMAVVTSYIIGVTCLGLLLANLVSTPSQLGAFSPVIIVATSMIGGCMWPLEIISSKVLLFMADLTPQRWAYSGLKTIIVNNGTLTDVLPQIINILIIAIVLFILAMIPYKYYEEN